LSKRKEAKPIAGATPPETATAAVTATPPAAIEKQTNATGDVVTNPLPSSEGTPRDGSSPARETEPAASHVKTDDDRQSISVITTAALGGPSADGSQPPALASYRVLSPIKLGGLVRSVGTKIELTNDEAADVGSKFIALVDA
jgi:hypothetical protein